MSRPLRIEYHDAWYHVMNRGRRGDDLFLEEGDYLRFKTLMKESSDMWNVRICAYCLMPNHYHLLVQTPNANLSRFMRHLNGVYTQRFNRHHKLDGQLFRGRYKSILIGESDYLIELLRYIHFNPVKAGLVKEPKNYTWSSFHSYMAKPEADRWLDTKLVFDQIRGKRKTKKEKSEILGRDALEETYDFYSKNNVLSILGSRDFIDQIKKGFFRSLVHPEIPDAKKLAKEARAIIQIVSNHFEISQEKLFVHKRARDNTPRDIAMYLIRMETSKPLAEIGELFHMDKYGSVSSCINRIKRRMAEDKHLNQTLELIKSNID
jgi:putative transposase